VGRMVIPAIIFGDVGDSALEADSGGPTWRVEKAAVNSSSIEDVLVVWRKELVHCLLNDPQNLLGGKRPTLARSITEAFPDEATVRAYATPVTSFVANHTFEVNRKLSEPALLTLAHLSYERFSFGSHEETLDKLRKTCYAGILTNALNMALGGGGATAGSSHVSGGTFAMNSIAIKRMRSGSTSTAEYEVSADFGRVARSLQLGLPIENGVLTMPVSTSVKKDTVFVLGAILARVFPDRVEEFHQNAGTDNPFSFLLPPPPPPAPAADGNFGNNEPVDDHVVVDQDGGEDLADDDVVSNVGDAVIDLTLEAEDIIDLTADDVISISDSDGDVELISLF